MKATIWAVAIGAILLLAGCKDDPLTPSSPAAPPSVSELNARALTLFNQGIEILVAATALQSEYRFGVDTLASALYRAGYSTVDLVRALRSVFHAPPRTCEGVLLKVTVRVPPDAIADMILRIYVDSLSRQPYDLRHFLQQLPSFDRCLGILDSLYTLPPEDILKLLYSFSPDIAGIVTSLHRYFPGLTERDLVLFMRQMKCSALDASKALQAISNKPTTEIAEFLKNAGYNISEVLQAIRSVYRADLPELAAILDRLGCQIAESLGILRSSGFSLDDLAALLKTHYHQTAAQAAELLSRVTSDLPALGSTLKNQFSLSDIELSLIIVNLGHTAPDIVIMLKGMGSSAADVINVLRAIFTKSEAEIAALLKDNGYLMTDVLLALRAIYNTSDPQIAAILDQLGYSTVDVLAILKETGCSIDELTMILKDHYGQSAQQAAEYLRQIHADFPAIANALKQRYALQLIDIALILKNLGGQIRDIVPILLSWSESIQNIVSVLQSTGFSRCDILHYFGLPC